MARSSASDVLRACVYMGRSSLDLLGSTYNINHELQVIFVTHSRSAKPARQFRPGLRQRPVLVDGVLVKPLFGHRKQAAIDLATELARRPARPPLGQQQCRQQGIAQHYTAIVMDQQNAGGESIGLRKRLATGDPTA